MRKRMSMAVAAALALSTPPAWAQQAATEATVAPEKAPEPVQEEAKTLPAVEVTAQREETVRQAQAAKSDVPLLETPQAISVVTADSLRDRGITRLAEALRGVAGVSRSSTYGYYDSYQIRGFDAAYGSIYLDGLLSGNVAGTNNELAGLERVEVLKGPASMLYGSAPLGGIVNLVSKRPRNERFVDLGYAIGSYGLVENTLDANAPLGSSGEWLGRVNVAFRDSDDFVKYSGNQRLFIAPALTWAPQAGTSLTFLGRYQRDRDNPWSPVPASGTVKPNPNGRLPIDFSVNDDEGAEQNQDHLQLGYAFDHAFSEALTFQQNLRYTRYKTFWDRWMFAGPFIDSSTISRYYYGPFEGNEREFAVDSRLAYKLVLGGVKQNLSGGVDYRYRRGASTDAGGNFDDGANPLDLFYPDYSVPLEPRGNPPSPSSSRSLERQIGFYVQDHIQFGERLTLTLSGRYDTAESGGVKDEKFSPRAGATYLLMPGLAAYGSWSRSFTPQGSYRTASGKPLPPETGRNIEAGFKVNSADGRIEGMLSVFRLTRQNVATDDPDPTAPLFTFITSGEQETRGFELEGQWRPLPSWLLAVAYANLDAEVTRDEEFTIGARLPNVPRDGLHLHTEYVIPAGALKDLGFSLSYLHNTSKNGSLYEDLSLPGYEILDAGLSYRLRDWQARLNVNNLLDERYYPDAGGGERVTPGEPRNWRLSLTRTF
jgi:iron complex outermembrane receptor protein